VIDATLAALALAAAQEAPAPAQEIVVTARRADAAQAAVPQQIGRLDAEDIDLIRQDHVAEALFRVPGVYIHRGNGQEHLTSIRSPVLTGGAGAGSFLYLEDGVPLRAAGFANVNALFEAHAELAGGLEVTKGPGSALYGSNAVHGVINVLTRDPDESPAGFAELSGGAFGRYGGRGFVSSGWGGGRHAAWIGATLIHEDGFRADSGLDQQKLTLRHDFEGAAISARTVVSAVNLNQETAGFVIGPDAYRDPELRRTNPNPEAFRDVRALRWHTRLAVDAGADAELVVTPFARWTDMDFLQHFLPGTPLEENGHWSVGAQTALYRRFGESLVVVGVDAEFTRGFLTEVQEAESFGPFPQGVHYDYEIDAAVAAPFVHAEWQAAERLRVTAGLRAEYARYDYATNTPADTVGRYKRPADRVDDFLTATPKFGAVYDIAPAHQLFANYARGARAPQTTDLYRIQSRQAVGEIEPETIDSIEFGARGRLGRVRYSLAAYFMDKRNFFFRDADGLNVTDGRTRHVGLEVEAEAPLSETLTLAGNAAWARHTYRFDRPVSQNVTESIAFGNEVDTAPNWLADVRLRWTPIPRATAELEWIHVGAYFTDAANAHVYPGHNLINLRLAWQADKTWRIFATARNLTDARYAERADFFFGNERYFPGESLALSGGVSATF